MRYLAVLCCGGLVFAQGTEPRAKAQDYEVHDAVKGVAIGAEYMVYSVSGQGKTFVIPDHLVVEVALFPPRPGSVTASASEFQLRVDGRMLRPVTPQMVVTAIERQEWRQPRGVQATAGMGDDVVILGGPTRGQPPYGNRRTTPMPPRAPEPENRSGIPPAPPVRAEELVVSTAFPAGEHRGPVSGFLYFPYTAKASKIRSVELIYDDARLKLK